MVAAATGNPALLLVLWEGVPVLFLDWREAPSITFLFFLLLLLGYRDARLFASLESSFPQ